MKIESFTVSSQTYNKLERYKTYSLDNDKLDRLGRLDFDNSNSIGNIVENISELYLNAHFDEVIKLDKRKFQKVCGDFLVMCDNYTPKYIECKSSHTFNGIDKVALDYEYYNKNTDEPYIPLDNHWGNKGYLHYCNANILFCVNLLSKKIYIILDFQKLKESLLELIDKHTDKELQELYNIEGSTKHDSNKRSKIYNIDFRYLHKLDVDMLECDIIEQEINTGNKKALDCESKALAR